MAKGQWIEYTGSDEQIDELKNNEHGYIVRDNLGSLSTRIMVAFDLDGVNILPFEYLICNPHPLRDMIKRQADTGQEVWIRLKGYERFSPALYKEYWFIDGYSVIKTTTPDWKIPNAEYSFTPFEGK